MERESTLISGQPLVRDRPKARGARLDRGLVLLGLLCVLTAPLQTARVAASDEIEYFAYLHSLLFDHDLNFRNEYEHYCQLDPVDCVQSRFAKTFLEDQTPTGLPVNFGPLGSALLWSPFYLLAHGLTLLLRALHLAPAGWAADGYSPPYVGAISFASLLYGWAGVALSYRLARRFVEPAIALSAALVVLAATNALYYVYVAPAMSHAPSLFASALFVWLWSRTREARAAGRWGDWALLGAAGALMTLVREQEALFAVIPLVENAWLAAAACRGREYSKIRLLLAGPAVMLVVWLAVFSPQLAVYRVLNGNFLPARDVTQKFTWDGAHIGDVLFSDLHGLFSWTPVTLLAVAGLGLLWRRDRIAAAALLAALAAEIYLLGSFSTWFGGAAFGMRRFVNCTILFVLGLALVADHLRARVPRPALAAAGALLAVWNVLLIVQFATGLIARDAPVPLALLAYNQVVVVPPRLADIAWRFVTNRSSFTRH